MSTASNVAAPAEETPAAEAHGISKRYGSTVALRDAGIVVSPGKTHALVGRNGAGKSTLVSILTGMEPPDSGTVTFNGSPAPSLADREAWRQRVACVYQKSTIIPNLTVAENLYLNRQPRGSGSAISWRQMRRQARTLLDTWHLSIDVDALASDLNVEQRQLVEIARALSYDTRFIILDEPTAQLDRAAINRLFDRIRGLQHRGMTFLFISHHLEEIYEICQRVTVFRDARHVLTDDVAAVPTRDLVAAMTGEVVLHSVAARSATAAASEPVTLDVAELVVEPDAPAVSFQLRRGEVVGLAGGNGSGKTHIAETIVGLRKAHSGSISVNGHRAKPGNVGSALRSGVAFVPQDRHTEGYVGGLSIAENLTMTVPDLVGAHGVLSPKRRDALARRLIDDLSVKTPGPELPVAALSGGNQQKVVMGRALASNPKLLVLIAPTAGVDVRSKATLLGVVDEIRARGTAVLVVSDELDDLRVCDRVIAIFRGEIVREFDADWADNELVLAMEGVGAIDDEH
ncbi:MAG: sugar ABC transporter ATP-binding protein [Acidothermaceae bacterium]